MRGDRAGLTGGFWIPLLGCISRRRCTPDLQARCQPPQPNGHRVGGPLRPSVSSYNYAKWFFSELT